MKAQSHHFSSGLLWFLNLRLGAFLATSRNVESSLSSVPNLRPRVYQTKSDSLFMPLLRQNHLKIAVLEANYCPAYSQLQANSCGHPSAYWFALIRNSTIRSGQFRTCHAGPSYEPPCRWCTSYFLGCLPACTTRWWLRLLIWISHFWCRDLSW